jgi:hypothetical protein
LHSQEPDVVEVVPVVQVFGRDAELVASQTLFTVVSVPKESGNVFFQNYAPGIMYNNKIATSVRLTIYPMKLAESGKVLATKRICKCQMAMLGCKPFANN